MSIKIAKLWVIECPACEKRLALAAKTSFEVWPSRSDAVKALRNQTHDGSVRLTQYHTQEAQIAEICGKACLEKYLRS